MKKQHILHLLVLLICFAMLVACGGNAGSGSAGGTAAGASASAPAASSKEAASTEGGSLAGESGMRVGGLLDGSINDMGWCASAYKGLQAIEALGNEMSHKENIPLSDMEESAMAYADDGYNVIFGHGNYFLDPIKVVAPNYPDTQFFVFNGEASADNYTSMQCSDDQQGYLQGYIAGKLSKTGKVGFVGGMEIGPVVRASKAFEVGAKAANPDIEVVSTMIGSFDDSAKAKETTIAFAGSGIDVVAAFADMASLGVCEGATEQGILCVANGAGYMDMAPDAVVVEVEKDTSKAYLAAWDLYGSGTIEKGKVYTFGAAEGVIQVGEWNSAIQVDDAVKTDVANVYQQLVDGEIDVMSLIS